MLDLRAEGGMGAWLAGWLGMVLAVQSYGEFAQLGLQTRLGGIINLSVIRELGPVLAAVMLAGRVGSSMAAELATMRTTEQIDAIVTLGADPVHYLATPRFLACVLLMPLLTVLADFMGVMGGALTGNKERTAPTGTSPATPRHRPPIERSMTQASSA